MEEDLDYYLAMEEDAQQEEEDWGEEGGMEIEHLPTPLNSSTLAAPSGPTILPVAVSSVPKPAVVTSLSAPTNVAK